MFLLTWLQYKKQPLQTRLTAGFSALAIIFGLLFLFIFCFFVVDKISLYADSQTVLYLKVETGGHDDYYKNKIVESLLAEYGLSGLDRHWLNREIAVTCSSPDNHLNFRLLIRSSKASKIKDYLRSQQIAFQNPARDIIIVGATSQTIKRSHNPLVYWRFQDGLIKKDLLIVLRQPQKLSSGLEKSLAFLPKDLKLRGRTFNQGLLLSASGNGQIKPLVAPTFDLLIKSSRQNSDPTNFLTAITKDCSIINSFNYLFSGQESFVILAKKSDSQDFLSRYDFFLSSDAQIKADKQKPIESFLLNLAQTTESKEKSLYLNDGTKITLLNKNNDLIFTNENNLKILPLKNGDQLYYGNKNNRLIIGDNPNFQPTLPEISSDNYLFSKISNLPTGNPLKTFLKDFSFLEIENGKISVR
jgi:hypothetical protein